MRQKKTLRPAHFHAPGRTSVVKAVLDIDRQLAEIDRSFDLLLQATPVNAETAWREFRRSRFEKPPVFYYRPLAVDPVLLKRQLYLIPVERVEDPTLSYLFRQKQEELDRQITLLSDVDSPKFLQESLQVYGGVSDWLLEQGTELLDRVPTRSGERDEDWSARCDRVRQARTGGTRLLSTTMLRFLGDRFGARRHVCRPDGLRRSACSSAAGREYRAGESKRCCSTKSARTWSRATTAIISRFSNSKSAWPDTTAFRKGWRCWPNTWSAA